MIKLENIIKIYNPLIPENKALNDVNIEIENGESVAIIGASGSGKSTLMNIIGCLDGDFEGNYFLDGKDIKKMSMSEKANIRNKEIGFIFQHYNLISELNVYENIELPLLYRGETDTDTEKLIDSALERVGMLHKKNALPNELSGGQQQRVAIARALVGKPNIILADEPTGALDSKSGKEVIEFMNELNGEGTTIILITHDIDIAKKMKRVIRISDGEVVEDIRGE